MCRDLSDDRQSALRGSQESMCQTEGTARAKVGTWHRAWAVRGRKGREGWPGGQVEEGSQDEKALEKEEGARSGTGQEDDFGFVLDFLSIATSLGAVFLVPLSPQADHPLPAGSRSHIFSFLEGRREGPLFQLWGDTPALLLAPLRSSTHFAEENESKGCRLFLASVLGLGLPQDCRPQPACDFQLCQMQAV